MPLDYIASEHQHSASATHLPEHVGGAGATAPGGKNVNALEAGHQIGERDAAQQVSDQSRRKYTGDQR